MHFRNKKGVMFIMKFKYGRFLSFVHLCFNIFNLKKILKKPRHWNYYNYFSQILHQLISSTATILKNYVTMSLLGNRFFIYKYAFWSFLNIYSHLDSCYSFSYFFYFLLYLWVVVRIHVILVHDMFTVRVFYNY